jgi:hypothetical protein
MAQKKTYVGPLVLGVLALMLIGDTAIKVLVLAGFFAAAFSPWWI